MKTREQNHPARPWIDALLNAWPFCIHKDAVATLFAVALDQEGCHRPGPESLFWNGYVMLRLTLPCGLWLHIKPFRDRRLQLGIGWKLNGRFGLLARWQSDASAARGTHGPNFGQAPGWARGTA